MKTPLGPVIRGMLQLLAEQPWLLPLLVMLSLLAFLFEALAIYLLLPLFSVLLRRAGNDVPEEAGPIDGVFSAVGLEPSVEWLVAAIVGCIMLKGLTALANQAAFASANAGIGDRLRRRSFSRILAARQDFHDKQPPGALLNTLATETWRLSQGLQSLATLITNLCAVLVFLGVMVLLSWQLTLVTGVATAVIFLIVGAITSRAKRYGEAAVSANRTLAERIVEGLSGLRVIRLFGQEDYELRRFAKASDNVRRTFVKMDVVSAVPMPLLELLFAALLGLLILSAGGDELVGLVVFLALLQRMQPHVVGLLQSRIALLGLSAPLEDVHGLLRDPDAEPLADGTHVAPQPRRAIVLEDVTYHYPNTEDAALNDVRIELPIGKTTALVGTSGAGKSTVISLVCRLMDPVSGSVRVDGRDLRDLMLASWRSRLAVVPQDVYLFDASVRDNIAYGRSDVTDAAIEAAARAAQAHDFISALPQGYATKVGERGARFSGGQRQRIALARAIVRDPDVLILDEATNALDSLSERLVRDAVSRIGADRTMLIIAHRMASVEHADQVIVLKAGRVVEAGSPASLAKAGGLYAQLHEAERLSA